MWLMECPITDKEPTNSQMLLGLKFREDAKGLYVCALLGEPMVKADSGLCTNVSCLLKIFSTKI